MRIYKSILVLVITGGIFAQTSFGFVINAGNDFYQLSSEYSSTIEFRTDAFFSGAGPIAFGGNPIDPLNLYGTSIVIERKQNANVSPGLIDMDFIDIEIQSFSLKSVAPVNGYDIYINLGLISTGEMEVGYMDWTEEYGNRGFYSLATDLHAEIYLASAGSTYLDYYSDLDISISSYLDQGWFDKRTNQLPSTGSNFFSMGNLLLTGLSNDFNVNIWAQNTTVPEPASLIIMALGAICLRSGKSRI